MGIVFLPSLIVNRFTVTEEKRKDCGLKCYREICSNRENWIREIQREKLEKLRLANRSISQKIKLWIEINEESDGLED